MRNFLVGILLGSCATYWYFTQGDQLRLTLTELWERASSPPRAVRNHRTP